MERECVSRLLDLRHSRAKGSIFVRGKPVFEEEGRRRRTLALLEKEGFPAKKEGSQKDSTAEDEGPPAREDNLSTAREERIHFQRGKINLLRLEARR